MSQHQNLPSYEPRPAERAVLMSLAAAMKMAALAVILQGLVAMAAVSLVPLAGSGPAHDMARAGMVSLGALGLVYAIVSGVWTLSAGAAFQRVVQEDSGHIANLMRAIDGLKSYFGVIKAMLIVILVFVLAAGVLGVLAGASRAH